MVTSEEYLNFIIKPIQVGKFLVTIPDMMKYLWYRGAECTQCAQTLAYTQIYDGVSYIIKLDVDEEGNAYSVHFYADESLVEELPDKVANDSLKMLYPTISPITIGVVISAVVLFGMLVSGKLKLK